MNRRFRVACAATAAAVAGVLLAWPAAGSTTRSVGFGKPVWVDTQLAGSEGFVLYSTKYKRLVYAAHEGTTLLYRSGATGSPTGTGDFASTYRNQVNMWTSADNGGSWQRSDVAGTGFFTNPVFNQGFSDPDLTQDAAGTIYGSGIDLVNDS